MEQHGSPLLGALVRTAIGDGSGSWRRRWRSSGQRCGARARSRILAMGGGAMGGRETHRRWPGVGGKQRESEEGKQELGLWFYVVVGLTRLREGWATAA